MATRAKERIHKVIIDAPAHPVIRSRWLDARHVVLDFRGIRLPLKRGMTDNPGRRALFLSVEDLQASVRLILSLAWVTHLTRMVRL